MRLLFSRLSLVGVVLTVVLLSGAANALTFHKMTDTEVKSTVTRLVNEASSSGTQAEADELKSTLELAVRVRPIVELTDAQCPMPIKVMNGTSMPFFNVKVSATERRGAKGTPNKTFFHIPYLPAKSSVSGSVACSLKRGFAYGGAGADRDIYLSASPIGEHSRLDDEGMREILKTKVDANTSSYSFSAGSTGTAAADDLPYTGDETIDQILERARNKNKPAHAEKDAGAPDSTSAADEGKPAMASAILDEIESEADFKLFSTALLKSLEGAKQLGMFIRRSPGRPVVTSLVPILTAAPAANVAALLEQAMRDADPRAGAVLAAAAARVCGPGQSEALRASMWLSALAPEVRNVGAREAVLAKCGVGKEQLRARLKAAKGDQLGRALDGVQGELFDVAVGAMVDSKSLLAAEELLASTQNPTKFDAVAKASNSFVTAIPKKQELVRAVAAGRSGSLDETKAKWLDGRLAELHGQAADQATLREILGDMAAGKIANAEIRKIVLAHRKDAGPGAFEPFRASLGEKALVLSPAWVLAKADAGELDIVDVISRLRQAGDANVEKTTGSSYSRSSGTPGCRSSAANAAECLSAVHDLKLTKDALDPSFVESVFDFVRSDPRDEKVIQVVKTVAGIGIDVSPAVEALCAAAPTDPGRYGYGSGASDPLTSAIALGANNACIAHVRSQRSSAERMILVGIGVRLTLVFVPFGFVAMLARKRFVPVRAQLAKENAELEAVRGKAALMTRLEGRGADDSIASGVADAARWLTEQAAKGDSNGASAPDEVAAAGRALAALTPETRAALVTRTRALASRAGESGVVATCLCELEGIMLYLACFPGREDQPQTIRRQAGFAEGWPAHMAALVEACAADGKPKRVLSLAFMMRTDGARMTMLVGYDSETTHLVPEAFVADPTKDGAAARTHEHRYEISQTSAIA